MTKREREQCLSCRHFRNDPAYLESVVQGLATMSSAYGAARGDDGLCLRHDRYLSAYSWFRDYEADHLTKELSIKSS